MQYVFSVLPAIGSMLCWLVWIMCKAGEWVGTEWNFHLECTFHPHRTSKCFTNAVWITEQTLKSNHLWWGVGPTQKPFFPQFPNHSWWFSCNVDVGGSNPSTRKQNLGSQIRIGPVSYDIRGNSCLQSVRKKVDNNTIATSCIAFKNITFTGRWIDIICINRPSDKRWEIYFGMVW